jgi:excisionase family DNA binding protein
MKKNEATDLTLKLLTLKQTSRYLNVKESWLRSKIFSNEIPFIKMGHLLRFDEDELNKWVEAKKVQDR